MSHNEEHEGHRGARSSLKEPELGRPISFHMAVTPDVSAYVASAASTPTTTRLPSPATSPVTVGNGDGRRRCNGAHSIRTAVTAAVYANRWLGDLA